MATKISWTEGDLFHPSVPFEFIDRVFAIMALCPQHTFPCLSKRPKIMQNYFKKALPRISALVYNEKYGQRKSIFRDDTSRRIRDRFAGQNMASNETSREGSKDGRGVLPGGDSKSLCKGEGGILNDKRVSLHNSNPQRSTDGDRSTQGDLDLSQQANSKRLDYQSRKRNKRRQSPRKSNPNDIQPTEVSCFESIESKSSQATGKQASKDISNRKSSFRNSETSQKGNDDKRHSGQIQNETKGNIGNLQPPDVEAHLVWPLPNVWLGVTAENQEMADKRIPVLLQIPAVVRFVSIEPMLERMNISEIDTGHKWPFKSETSKLMPLVGGSYSQREDSVLDSNPESRFMDVSGPKMDQVIIGCESGPNRRPCKLEWIQDIVNQCKDADIKVFVKQLSINGKVEHDINEWPESLRLREMPK